MEMSLVNKMNEFQVLVQVWKSADQLHQKGHVIHLVSLDLIYNKKKKEG